MSITGFSHSDKIYRSIHRRNDSGELDVFEAARYFSGCNEVPGLMNGASFSQRNMREERQMWAGRRMSLDMPMRNPLPSESHHNIESQIKEKKHKQPRSPGGRLASFLNSLFHQAASKKKKSKSSAESMKDEEESPGGRRKRRSSISHFRSTSTTTDSKSLHSSSSSGFRTPPPCANTPTKMFKDIKSYSDHKQVAPLSTKYTCGQVIRSVNGLGLHHDEALNEKRNMDLSWLDEKLKFNDGFREKTKNVNSGFLEKDRTWVGEYNSSEKKNFTSFGEVDDGGESDSSSDLFELQNYDLGFYSSGLPVYETTQMDAIKRGAPILSGSCGTR
ncbi:PREDICTED: protein BIG GRAIN 1-like E [Nelumbo nucifera]|uniref:Protein BIG GRAIN 1-like E n=2 Tax=Nelumbo nucifera TaxID=4432 RepID=A0A822YJN1_NELNU|nr:PREDICTED: protein BIG GRAIN 1-like E [Nelumbo nucifera]DAD31519.1 TPA_asm: hypothetical protein HUJ06_010370 [Nelumbo nucifera]